MTKFKKAWKPATTVKTGLVMLLTAATISIFSLQSCGEKDPVVVTGSIDGIVTNADNGEPIQAAEVMITPSGKTAITGGDGYYTYKELEAGEYTVQVRKNGFQSNIKRVTVQQGQTAKCDVLLQTGTGYLTVNKTDISFGTNGSNSQTFELSNSGQVSVNWSVTEDCAWITSVAPQQGTLAAGAKQLITVTIDRTKLPQNNQDVSYQLIIESNSGNVTVNVSVGKVPALEVLNGEVSNITSTTAQSSGEITAAGSLTITQYGHCWSTQNNPTVSDNKTTLGNTTVAKTFNSNLAGLTPNTTYYVRAYATNSTGTTYSDEVIFTTLAPPTTATVQTVRTENITHNSIGGVGNISNLGDAQVTDYGFCYSGSNTTPTISDNKVTKGQTSQVGQFTVTLTNLQASTKYYIRAYATNSMGTAYGNVLEATTTAAPPAPPVVTSGLVAYYTFDNENCNEAQGNSQYNGVKTGSGTPLYSSDIPNQSGKSLQLNNDASFAVGQSPFEGATKNTYCIWLKMTVNCDVFNNGLEDYKPRMKVWDNEISPYYYSMNHGWTNFDLDVSTKLLDGQWHFVVVTAETTIAFDYYTLYIDGSQESILQSSYNPVVSNLVFQIGKGFIGKMDNFRVYNRLLTASEVLQIYSAKQ